jgi:hypothetical protein
MRVIGHSTYSQRFETIGTRNSAYVRPKPWLHFFRN